MKILTTIFNIIFVGLMLGVALVFLVPLLPIERNLELRIVESGSMEPKILTGSLVFILPAESYGVADVITFKSRSSDIPTTHRIVDTYEEDGRTWFITKGDANEEADSAAVAAADVLGKVQLAVPYAGFVLDFARQPLGFALLVVLPALMIIFGEIEKIWLEVRRRHEAGPEAVKEEDETLGPPPTAVRYAERAMRMMDIATPVRFRELPPTLYVKPLSLPPVRQPQLRQPTRTTEWATAAAVIFASSIFASVSFMPTTVSYFNDTERSADNAFEAVLLDFTATPDDDVFTFMGGELVDDADGSVVTNIVLEPGSVDARYDVSVQLIAGSPLLCSQIKVTTAAPAAVSSALTAFTLDNVAFAAPFQMALNIPDQSGLVGGEVCAVDVVYKAWHFDEVNDQGYFDEERTPLTFMYNPIELPAQLFSASLMGVDAPESADGNTESFDEAPEELVEPTEEEPVPPVPEPEHTPEPEEEPETEEAEVSDEGTEGEG